MPRANRGYVPGLVWHITQRCHKKEFLLKFIRDKKRWLFWLFQAKKRYGLCILNYSITSNHIHLLVYDDKRKNLIPNVMNLVSGRTAQEFNNRKNRKGAFWEDRYHSTAIQSDHHLIRCMIYIDLNMVRAGVVDHPENWRFCGYNEIRSSRKRYRLIDKSALIDLFNMKDQETLKHSYKTWLDDTIENSDIKRESRWTESIAVGSREFVEKISVGLGSGLKRRCILKQNEIFELHECMDPYNDDSAPENEVLSKERA